jgi:hypothetical protein
MILNLFLDIKSKELCKIQAINCDDREELSSHPSFGKSNMDAGCGRCYKIQTITTPVQAELTVF